MTQREIKFRCWDTDKKCWMKQENPQGNEWNNHYIAFNGLVWDRKNINGGDGDSLAKREFVLCQFTGLYDKNGKEVWEGDLINHSGTIYEIVFNNGGFTVRNTDSKSAVPASNDFLDNIYINVIGNIYENSELLVNTKE